MFLASPTYLFALFGLLVPLAIHLWNRKEGRVVKVGSIRFLTESDTSRSHSIKLNEILLLVLRMLLLTLLVLVLANPFYHRSGSSKKVLLIDPNLQDQKSVQVIVDSLRSDDYELYWFAIGFPRFDTEPDTTTQFTRYWQLADDLNGLQADTLTILSSAKLAQAIGARPELNQPVSWLTISDEDRKEFLIEAQPLSSDIQVVKGLSTSKGTVFTSHILKQDEPGYTRTDHTVSLQDGNTVAFNGDTLRIGFAPDEKYEQEAWYLEVAFKTIAEFANWPIKIVDPPFDSLDWLVTQPGNPTSEKSRYTIELYDDSLAVGLLNSTARNGVYRLAHQLTTDRIVEEDLIRDLFEIVRESKYAVRDRINPYDQRAIDERQLIPTYRANSATHNNYESLSPFLWTLFVIVLLAERGLSFSKKL